MKNHEYGWLLPIKQCNLSHTLKPGLELSEGRITVSDYIEYMKSDDPNFKLKMNFNKEADMITERKQRLKKLNTKALELFLKDAKEDVDTITKELERREKCGKIIVQAAMGIQNGSLLDENSLVRTEPHEMHAEGLCSEQPSKDSVFYYIASKGYASTNIDVWYDDYQKVWRWTCDIYKPF